MPFLLKLIYRFNAAPIKIARFSADTEKKVILQFTWKAKGTKIAKAILKKSKVRETNLSA